MHAGAWLDRLARSEANRATGCWRRWPSLRRTPPRSSRRSRTRRSCVDAGILDAPMADLEERWRASIAPVFADLDLPMPPPARDPERGRLDHGADFAWLWGEFTSVRRADPGATW